MLALEKNIEQLYHSGQLKEAVEKCDSLIQDYPFHYTGYLFKAHILSSTDSFHESLYLFNKAIFMCLNSVFRVKLEKFIMILVNYIQNVINLTSQSYIMY